MLLFKCFNDNLQCKSLAVSRNDDDLAFRPVGDHDLADLLDGARNARMEPKAIELLKKETANDPSVEVCSLPSLYPKGAEKVTIRAVFRVFEVSDFRTLHGFLQKTHFPSDGEQTVDENVKPPVVETHADFVKAIKNSGLVGLGGAGFPTHIKMNCAGTAR